MTDTKSIGDAINTHLQVGTAIRHGQLMDQISQNDIVRKQGIIDRQNTVMGHNLTINAGVQLQAMELEGALGRARVEVAAKNALILEWMHSNDGYRKIAREYGERLGLTTEDVRRDLAEAIVSLSETDPDYTHTRLGAAKRQQLGLTDAS